MERRDLVKSSEISPNLAENLLDLMNIYQIWYILVAKIHRIKLEKPSKLEKIAGFALLSGQANLLRFWRRRLVIDPSELGF